MWVLVWYVSESVVTVGIGVVGRIGKADFWLGFEWYFGVGRFGKVLCGVGLDFLK